MSKMFDRVLNTSLSCDFNFLTWCLSCVDQRCMRCSTFLSKQHPLSFHPSPQITSKIMFKHPSIVVRRCSVKKVFLTISQNQQEITCVISSFSTKKSRQTTCILKVAFKENINPLDTGGSGAVLHVQFKTVFKTRSNIYDGAFFREQLTSKFVNYFCKKVPSKMLDWIVNRLLQFTFCIEGEQFEIQYINPILQLVSFYIP